MKSIDRFGFILLILSKTKLKGINERPFENEYRLVELTSFPTKIYAI